MASSLAAAAADADADAARGRPTNSAAAPFVRRPILNIIEPLYATCSVLCCTADESDHPAGPCRASARSPLVHCNLLINLPRHPRRDYLSVGLPVCPSVC